MGDADLFALEQTPKLVKRLIREAHGENEIVDILGTIRSVERALADERQLAATEIPAGTAGRSWEFVQGMKWEKSFSTAKIMRDMQGAGITILDLIEADAVRLDWQYLKLKKMFRRADITLQMASHEIQPDDPDHHIGAYDKPGYPRYEPIEGDDK